ncbi:MAG: putative oxidoreductase C-terminal domain-containing protein [Bacteroidota bacterium]
MKKTIFLMVVLTGILMTMNNCKRPREAPDTNFTGAENEVVLMTLDPGHFHSSLVQKYMVPQVAPESYVYAPEGSDVQQHLDRIENFNTRDENPTNWEVNVYTGKDYLERMIEEKPGNVVVIAGNNAKKTTYINECVSNGLNVLADKPMVIFPEKYPELEEAFEMAEEKGIFLYDIMTERNEVTSILQKRLAHTPEIFGEMQEGSEEDPAFIQQSVHHWFKYVAGEPIQRPPWFFDETQWGKAISNVSTHLIDGIQWAAYPQQVLEKDDVELLNASSWTTSLNLEQFQKITRLEEWPSYLEEELEDGKLHVPSNGEINYTLKDMHARVRVEWDYQAPEGGGDTHYSLMRGSRCNLMIRQGEEEDYQPELYVELTGDRDPSAFEADLREVVGNDLGYDDLGVNKVEDNFWKIDLPERHREGHEAHFTTVMEQYLDYLKEGEIPDWETSYMRVKYYLTTQALKMAEKE